MMHGCKLIMAYQVYQKLLELNELQAIGSVNKINCRF